MEQKIRMAMRPTFILALMLMALVEWNAAAQSHDASEAPFFYRQRLFAPGDYGSANYRIPAIVALRDGSLLVANDRRKYNEGDLPQDIDIVVRRSEDHGRTWTEPVTIAEGQGIGHGFGDPALVTTAGGDIVCAYAGGNGYFASTAENPISVYITRSSDGGSSWSPAENITATLWGAGLDHYHGAFIASGNGLRLMRGFHAGRLLFAAALCRTADNGSDNYIVYSDDDGHTWKRSQIAYTNGDEAKLMELADGRVLLSVRRTGARGWSLSDDGGETWGTQGEWPEMMANACNGEMLRMAATDQGDTMNLLLHSIPNSMRRENVSIYSSTDEGQSWHDPVTLCEGPSVYSSMTLLDDGTIGAYVEVNTEKGCELWYYNFNLAWLKAETLKKTFSR